MRTRIKSSLIFGMVLWLTGCAVLGPAREGPKATGYVLARLPERWIKLEASDAEGTFESKDTRAIISFNSVCGRYQDSSLEALSQQLLGTYSDPEIVSQNPKQIDGREALITRVVGKLDGVEVESQFVVLRKNNCLFDFTLLRTNRFVAQDLQDFDRWIENFRFPSSRIQGAGASR